MLAGKWMRAGLLLVSGCYAALGQLPPAVSPLTATTPGINTPGRPDGVYALGDFDTVNLANGAMNFLLPLVHVPGRGQAKTTLSLRFGLSWHVDSLPVQTDCVNSVCQTAYSYSVAPTNWYPLQPTPGFGMMLARRSGDGIVNVSQGTCLWQSALTRLTYVAPDGTETEFRDVLTGGQPKSGSQPTFEFNRGKVWVAKDGSEAQYTSLSDIKDPNLCGAGSGAAPDGTLQLRDGTKYLVRSGYVTQVIDRNGNTLTSTQASNGTQAITDSYGRTTTVAYTAGGMLFSYPGGLGTEAVVVSYSNLQSVQRDSATVGKTLDDLFPNICSEIQLPNGCLQPGPGGVDVQDLVSSIELPNGISYSFRYDQYGNVARVVLPTGGAYEYDYTTRDIPSTQGGAYSGAVAFLIQSRLSQKRVYKSSADTTPEQTITYSYGSGTYQSATVPVTTVTYRDGAKVAHTFAAFLSESPTLSGIYYPGWMEGREVKTDYYDTDGKTLLRTEQHALSQRGCVSGEVCWFIGANTAANATVCYSNCSATVSDPSAPGHSPRVDQTTTTLDSGEVKQESYGYDDYNNRTSTAEYGYGAGSAGALIRTRTTSFLPSPTGTRLLSLPSQEKTYDASNATSAVTNYAYDENVLADASGAVEHSASFGTSYATRGNPTTISRWVTGGTVGGTWSGATDCTTNLLCTKVGYDILGNVTRVVDPRGVQTDYGYADSRNSYALPTSVKSYAGLNSTQGISSVPAGTVFTASAVYNYDIGKATSTTDVNGQVTGYTYSDHFNRLTGVAYPDGGHTGVLYTDTANAVSVAVHRDQTVPGDGKLQAATAYDGLGRVSVTTVNEGSGGGVASAISVARAYDTRGRLLSVSNPYRGSAAEYTWTLYDGLGRVTSVAYPDGSVARNRYYGSSTLAVDEAGNNRQLRMDAAGRLAAVYENQTSWKGSAAGQAGQATYATSYTWTALDGLNTVVQGPQTRTFLYDSAGRLRSAANPESGTWQYTYDKSGNVWTRTGGRGLVATMGYDGLNRVSSKSYSDATPGVAYGYDSGGSAANALGRLTSVSVPGVLRSYGPFDAMGRVVGSSESVGTAVYQFGYGYDLAAEMVAEQYPSGRIVTTGYDPAGRVASVAGSVGSVATAYATMPGDPAQAYTQYGTVWHVGLGNGVAEVSSYYSRVQLTGLTASKGGTVLLGLALAYSAFGANNGNVTGQTITGSGSAGRSQVYLYDAVNRICAAGEGGAWTAGATSCSGAVAAAGGAAWWQGYSFDQFGNRAVSGTMPNADSTPALLNQFSNNQWSRGAGDSYDADGNMKTAASNGAPGTAASTFVFDAENRMVSANVSGTGAVSYLYDGEGRRVAKYVGGALASTYVYDASGELTAEYGSSGGGGTSTVYRTADHLGSTRLVTDASGNVVRRYDYLPYGEEQTGGAYPQGADPVTEVKFTGKVRDWESGLDYSLYRYSSAAQGRWMSADPLPGWPSDPQSWNRYAYVRNNPLKYVDPLGLTYKVCDSDGKNCNNLDDATFEQERKSGQKNHERFSRGKMSHVDANGRTVVDGTFSHTDIDSKNGPALVGEMGRRADAQLTMIGAVAGGSAAAGAAAVTIAPAAGALVARGAAASVGWFYGLTGGTGVVLGSYNEYPNYLEVAESIGANAYNVPSWLWSTLNATGQAWTANRAFLDASIARGQQFYLSTPPIGASGYFQQELQYLINRGIGANQWQMVPK